MTYNYENTVINIKNPPYGAIGDGSSHPLSTKYANLAAAQVIYPFATSLTNEIDWCAIQLAVNTVAIAYPNTNPQDIRGGTVYIPRGVYYCDQPINCAGITGITLAGNGGSGVVGIAEGSGTLLIYTGTGTLAGWYANTSGSVFINAQSTQSFTLKDMSLIYTNTGFLGVLVDLSHSGPGHDGANDTTKATIINCSFSAGALIPVGTGAFALLSFWELSSAWWKTAPSELHNMLSEVLRSTMEESATPML